jgi:D-3-phosphoglycerate dehydrogenase
MATIVAIKHPAVERLMAASIERLRHTQHTIVVFASYREFTEARSWPSEIDILFVSSGCPCTRSFLESLPALKGVVFVGSGTGSIDLNVATELGILVAHGAAAINAESMAESTIMLMLALLHDMHRTERELRENLQQPCWPHARTLKGRTIGLVGYGKIAEAIAMRLRYWGARLLISSRHLSRSDVPPYCELTDLSTLVAESDIVSLHAHYSAGEPPLIGAAEIAGMKPGAFLINTARGGLVDESVLLNALSLGKLCGAALDTFQVEPLPADSPFRKLPNVILTPHAIGHSADGYASMVDTAVENITRLALGEPPLFLCNSAALLVRKSRIRTVS